MATKYFDEKDKANLLKKGYKETKNKLYLQAPNGDMVRVRPGSGTTAASRASAKKSGDATLGYKDEQGIKQAQNRGMDVKVDAEQVRALYDAGENVPDYAVGAIQQQSQQPRTLANMESPASVGGRTVTGTEQFPLGVRATYDDGSQVTYSNQEWAGLTGVTQGVLDGLQQQGFTINPNVEITAERAAEFMKFAEKNASKFLPYAQKEIAPFYENQFKLARESFLNELGYSRDEILRQEQELERQYGQDVRSIGESAAEQGFAQSGLRQRAERDLATDTQSVLDSGRRQLGYGAGNAARQFAQLYGSKNLPTLSLSKAPRVLAGGGFSRPGGQNQMYQLSDDIYDKLTGSKEFEQRAQEQGRAFELEGQYNSFAATPQPRQF